MIIYQSKEEDYETILSTLSRDIQSRQQNLADIRLRGRRSTLWSTLYIAAAYVAYVCLWNFRVLTLPRGVSLTPVIVEIPACSDRCLACCLSVG